jgi:phosphate transport system permease protein
MITKKITSSYLKNIFFKNLFKLSSLTSILILISLLLFLLKESTPMLKDVGITDFLFSRKWNPDGWDGQYFGILNLLYSTLYVSFLTMVISIPMGIFAAIFISELSPPLLKNILKPLIELLAGIPSVVIGFFGIVFVGPLIAKVFHQYNILSALNGAFLLSIMVLPTIISLSDDAITAVSDDLRHASLALGANRLEMIFTILLPAARSGILAAIMLGFGRAIGETMAVLMACGNALRFTGSLFDPIKTITASIAIEMGEVAYYSTHYYALFAIGLVLFLLSFIINNVAELIIKKGHQTRC